MITIRCPSCGHITYVKEKQGTVRCSNVYCRGTIKYDKDTGETSYSPRQKHIPLKDRTTSSGVIFSR